jgi:hypothetical protein
MGYEAVPQLFTFYAVPLLGIAMLMFSMTIYKCGRQLLAVRFAAHMPMITLFLRDGVFLFFTIMREINLNCRHLVSCLIYYWQYIHL